jgi:hypothetical protein
MSKLRPIGVRDSNDPAMSDDTALFLIRQSVLRRKELIFGKLDDENGAHCAIGAFWADNPYVTLRSSLIDEVAAVNDSVPSTATPRQRWKVVNSWLRFKVAALAGGKVALEPKP